MQELAGDLLGIRQEAASVGAYARNVRRTRSLVHDEYRLLRSFPIPHSTPQSARRIDGRVQDAEVERQSADEQTRIGLIDGLLQQRLQITRKM